MSNLSFSIANLKCGYQSKDVVLEISELEIPSSGLVFVVGPSGSGKSTFLETLGLMNNSIRNPGEARIDFSRSADIGKENLIQSWTKTEDFRADLRNEYFSFLFQQTNLMPHFTAGENMCMAMLIEGYSFHDAKERVLEVMKLLDLDEAIFGRRTSELSGGQRQRLAFVRAFTGRYKILFGDEPTGNLDAGTARKLMDVLKNQVVEKVDRVCLIVSHDLDLAQQYADMIIPIQFVMSADQENRKYGFVSSQTVFHRRGDEWYNHIGPIDNFRAKLSDIIVSRSAINSAT